MGVHQIYELTSKRANLTPSIEILHLGIYPTEILTRGQNDECTKLFIAPLFMRLKNWNQPKCPLTGTG